MVNKQAVHIEVVLRPTAHASPALFSSWLKKRLSFAVSVFRNGPLPQSSYTAPAAGAGDNSTAEEQQMSSSILRVAVVDLPPNSSVSFWMADLQIHAYVEIDTEPDQDFLDSDGEGLPAFEQWDLPHAGLEGLWESIVVDPRVKARLLAYLDTS